MAQRDYQAYLLRLWREKEDGRWRASLENPHTGERAAFAALPELFSFLEEKAGEEGRPVPPKPAPAPFDKELNDG